MDSTGFQQFFSHNYVLVVAVFGLFVSCETGIDDLCRAATTIPEWFSDQQTLGGRVLADPCQGLYAATLNRSIRPFRFPQVLVYRRYRHHGSGSV